MILPRGVHFPYRLLTAIRKNIRTRNLSCPLEFQPPGSIYRSTGMRLTGFIVEAAAMNGATTTKGEVFTSYNCLKIPQRGIPEADHDNSADV